LPFSFSAKKSIGFGYLIRQSHTGKWISPDIFATLPVLASSACSKQGSKFLSDDAERKQTISYGYLTYLTNQFSFILIFKKKK